MFTHRGIYFEFKSASAFSGLPQSMSGSLQQIEQVLIRRNFVHFFWTKTNMSHIVMFLVLVLVCCSSGRPGWSSSQEGQQPETTTVNCRPLGGLCRRVEPDGSSRGRACCSGSSCVFDYSSSGARYFKCKRN